jgi:hypothetical protein
MSDTERARQLFNELKQHVLESYPVKSRDVLGAVGGLYVLALMTEVSLLPPDLARASVQSHLYFLEQAAQRCLADRVGA